MAIGPPGQRPAGRFVLEQALAGGYEARRTVLDAVDADFRSAASSRRCSPAPRRLGERWAAGQLSVGQEHEVSAIARDVVGEVAARLPDPARLRLGAVVAACPAGERHDLGLRMAAAVRDGAG